MKTLRYPPAAKRCGVLFALLCLAFSPRAFAQQIGLGPLPRIISPANNAVFYTPVDIPIFAYTLRTNVEFFAGTNDLGRGFNLGMGSADSPSPGRAQPDFVIAGENPRLTHIFYRVWTNVPPGSYALTVVVTGSVDGVSSMARTSPPVNITVLAAITNTNPTDIVSIVASDPIAIADTNSWVWLGMTNDTPTWANWPPAHFQSFTNWGPKNAIFTVRRFGDASNPIIVNYSIGGTASNGVDYVKLPGNVTIPAGGPYALIPIVPIDTNSFPKTVVLALTPDTNMPPDYVVGIPSRAAALILRNRLNPFPFLLPDGSFHVNASGPDGAWFSIQNSSDLQNWSSVSTNQVFQGSIDFVDPDAPDFSSRFYRAMPVTNTPAN